MVERKDICSRQPNASYDDCRRVVEWSCVAQLERERSLEFILSGMVLDTSVCRFVWLTNSKMAGELGKRKNPQRKMNRRPPPTSDCTGLAMSWPLKFDLDCSPVNRGVR